MTPMQIDFGDKAPERVIGIDLGMELLAIENHRTGLVWALMDSFYSIPWARRAAGFHLTLEPEPRPVHRPGANTTVGAIVS